MSVARYWIMMTIALQSAALYATPSDYAWKATLDSKDGELNKVTISADIIEGLARSDFGDLVVLDANGSAAPSWVRPMQQVTEELEVPLSVHTFSEYDGAHSKTVTATQESASKDSRSSIKTMETVRVAKASNAFIIELSDYQLALGINALRLDWTTEDPTQLLRLRVDASNSLNDWQTVHNKMTLALAKDQDDNNRDWQRINDIPASKRYIRLSGTEPELAITINGVSGIYQEPTLQTIEWVSYAATEPEPASDIAYRFKMPSGVLPARMRLKPAQHKQIIKGSIYAGNGKYRNKRTLFPNIQQHNLEPANNIIASPSYSVPRQRYNNWWFESEIVLQQPPLLEVGYKRHELLFLANGKAPYALYWGNYEAPPPAQLLREVLQDDEDTNAAFPAKIAKKETAAGAQRQFKVDKLPWLTWALWLLLGIAAVFTARMAISLIREMK